MRAPSSLKSGRLAEALRITGLFSLLVVVGVLATGCSKKPATTTTSTNSEILIRIWRTGQSEDVLKSKMNQFMQKNAASNVKVSYAEKKLNSYELDALKSMASRQGPDIWSIPNDWVGDHTSRLTALPQDFFYPRNSKGERAVTGTSPAEYVKESYPEGIAEQLIGTDTTSVYGLPTNVDSLRLYVNTNLLTTAFQEYRQSLGSSVKSEQITPIQQLMSKPATTWVDLVEQSKYIIKRSGDSIERAAVALGTADNIPYAQDIVQLLMMQNGAQIVSTDRKNALFHLRNTTASGVSVRPGELALDFYTSFSNPSKSTYTWNASMPQAIDAFGQGKVAMIFGYSDIDQQLKIKYPRFSYQVAPIPQKSVTETPVNMLHFMVEGVTKTANNTAAALAFLATYTDKETTQSIAQQSKLLSPHLEALNPRKDDPFVKQVLTGKAVYKKSRPQFDEIFRQMIIDVTQNGVPQAQALDGTAEAINQLLQDDSQL